MVLVEAAHRDDPVRNPATTRAWHCPRPKVVGLGAPISVRIYVETREEPVLRHVLDSLITGSGRARRKPSDDELAELRQMRRDMEARSERADETVSVVWPTALAHRVLRQAVAQAGDRLHDALADLTALEAIRDAMDVFRCCLASWDALQRVDGGGLQDVWL
jgi:hypothetical protein